jgi:hypothetical protein
VQGSSGYRKEANEKAMLGVDLFSFCEREKKQKRKQFLYYYEVKGILISENKVKQRNKKIKLL